MDKELLAAIGQMIDEKLRPFQLDISGIHQDISEIRHEVVKTNLKIENDVIKRLDSLTDGYILNHEKQYDLERQMTALQRRVEALEVKVS